MRHVPQCGPSILNGTSLAKFHWLSGPSAPPEKAKLGEGGTEKALPCPALPCAARGDAQDRIGCDTAVPLLQSQHDAMAP
jgi:hypothetical protein